MRRSPRAQGTPTSDTGFREDDMDLADASGSMSTAV
jgi:hypothetical protein